MEVLVQILITKLVELLVKKAEAKFARPKSGKDKKAFVLDAVNKAFDTDGDGTLKEEFASFIDTTIDETVSNIINKEK